jgi:hypothetical protein
MSGVPQHACTNCGNAGHKASRCKELGVPLEGFYKPSPGMHQGDDDDCDEAITIRSKERYNKASVIGQKRSRTAEPVKYLHAIWLNQLMSGPRVRRLF